MKNKWVVLAGVAVTLMGLNLSVQAVPITGSLNFIGGTVTYNSTAITAFGRGTTVNDLPGTLPTGSYLGTGGASVAFAPGGFTFAPTLNPNPVSPLWQFTSGGLDYSFALTGITAYSEAFGLSVSGFGTLSISGGAYDPTPGIFTLSGTGVGSTIGFTAMSAVSSAVPDGGTTVLLLGVALLAISLFPKKMAA